MPILHVGSWGSNERAAVCLYSSAGHRKHYLDPISAPCSDAPRNTKIVRKIMNNPKDQSDPVNRIQRRQALSGIAVALSGLTISFDAWGEPQQQSMKETPSTAANQTRTSLHQEIDLKGSPQRVYEILLDAKQFTAFTGMPAEIDPRAGGAFSTFGGLIVGRNVELIPNARIIQAWRPTHWNPGVYSIVHFELKPQGGETLLVLDHTGFPEGEFDHLTDGWRSHYWEPLTKYLV
jgi:uncharacterized protein YndB with AHSA1/START domain